MRRDMGVTLGLLAVAGLLFLLPAGLLRDCRLKLYSLFRGSQKAVEQMQEERNTRAIEDGKTAPDTVYDPSVPPEQRLRELTRQLIGKDSEIAALRQELRNLGDFRTAFPTVKIIPVRVIGFSGSREEPAVFLSAGTNERVAVDNTLAQGTAYAGTVVRVDHDAAFALLPSHPGCLVDGRAVKSRDICSVRGLGAGRAQAVFYVGQTATAPGERIITSGMLGKAPEGLIIGSIEEYPRRGREPGTLEAPVKLEANLSTLEDLVIVGWQAAGATGQPATPSGAATKPASSASPSLGGR